MEGSKNGGLGVRVASELRWLCQQGGSSGVFAESPVGGSGIVSDPSHFGKVNYLIAFYTFIFSLNMLEWILFAGKNSKQYSS